MTTDDFSQETKEMAVNVAKSIKKQRKNAVRIMNAILKSIDSYPKSSHEICLDIRSDIRTVDKYLFVLHDRGTIKKAKFKDGLLWIKR